MYICIYVYVYVYIYIYIYIHSGRLLYCPVVLRVYSLDPKTDTSETNTSTCADFAHVT